MARVSAEPARLHIEALLARFPTLSATHYGHLAGVQHSVVLAACKPGARAYEHTIATLLAVRAEHVALVPPPFLPVGPVKAHLERLLTVPGASGQAIARAVPEGVTHTTVMHILQDRKWRLRVATWQALMNLTEDDVRGTAGWFPRWISATRIRALEANGWSYSAMAEVLGAGQTKRTIDSVLNHGSDKVTAYVHRRIESLYHRIGDTPGPSAWAAQHARRLGYLPPIHYDDDMRLVTARDADGIEQEESRLRLCILGLSLRDWPTAQIAQRLGVTIDRVVQTRYRAGLTVERPEDVVAAIGETLDGIVCTERIGVVDAPDLDYAGRWMHLRRQTWREPVAA